MQFEETTAHVIHIALKVDHIHFLLLLRHVLHQHGAETCFTNVRVSQALWFDWILLLEVEGCRLEGLRGANAVHLEHLGLFDVNSLV